MMNEHARPAAATAKEALYLRFSPLKAMETSIRTGTEAHAYNGKKYVDGLL